VSDVVNKHAAGAGIREDRAHAYDTFCTMLTEHGDAQISVDVTDQRKNDGVAALEQARPGVMVSLGWAPTPRPSRAASCYGWQLAPGRHPAAGPV